MHTHRRRRARARSCSIRARSGPSPTSSSVAPSRPATASTAWSSAWNRRKLPTQPTTNRPLEPEAAARRVAVGQRAEQLGIGAGRRDHDAVGRRRRCAGPARRPPPSRTPRRRRAAAARARRRARSSGSSPAGARPTAAPATRAAPARTPPTARRARARAAGPRSWNSSWRCHTHAMSWPRHGPAASTRNAARASPLARVLDRGLRDHRHPPLPARRRAGAERRGRRARARSSSGVHHALGRDDPRRRRAGGAAPLAHPAVLTHAATGPCWPAATVGSTRIAPRPGVVVPSAPRSTRQFPSFGSRYLGMAR